MAYEFPEPVQEILDEKKETTPERESKPRAEKICQKGEYEAILREFFLPENRGLLKEQITRLQRESKHTSLREALPKLREHDWEMLTILELFDRATFEHCVRTYQVAKQKIESTGPVGEYLRQEIEQEGLTPWDIERACLLHDMGKIVLVPKEATLNNTLSNEDWHRLFENFCHEAHSSEEGRALLEEYEETLTKNPILRPKDLTPIHLGISPEDRETLEAQGVDTNLSFGAVINRHQDVSVEIIERYPENAALLNLVGNHHEDPLKPTAGLSAVVDTLRLADVYDAYRSARPYKKEEAVFSSLALLIKKAGWGVVDPTLTRLWVEDELSRINPKSYLNALKHHKSPRLEKEAESYEIIKAFLEK